MRWSDDRERLRHEHRLEVMRLWVFEVHNALSVARVSLVKDPSQGDAGLTGLRSATVAC